MTPKWSWHFQGGQYPCVYYRPPRKPKLLSIWLYFELFLSVQYMSPRDLNIRPFHVLWVVCDLRPNFEKSAQKWSKNWLWHAQGQRDPCVYTCTRCQNCHLFTLRWAVFELGLNWEKTTPNDPQMKLTRSAQNDLHVLYNSQGPTFRRADYECFALWWTIFEEIMRFLNFSLITM